MQDAFSAGVEPGGLYTVQEIKILICYMLLGVGEPLPRDAITDILAGDGMANFFETTAAIDELTRQGHLTEQDDLVSLTDTGRQVASTLSGRVPYTLRERSVKAALRLLTRRRREAENSVDIQKMETGVQVTCAIRDGETPLMSISLHVADDMQAQLVREHFLDDPTLLYRSLLAILTGDAGMKRADTQIVIDLK